MLVTSIDVWLVYHLLHKVCARKYFRENGSRGESPLPVYTPAMTLGFWIILHLLFS